MEVVFAAIFTDGGEVVSRASGANSEHEELSGMKRNVESKKRTAEVMCRAVFTGDDMAVGDVNFTLSNRCRSGARTMEVKHSREPDKVAVATTSNGGGAKMEPRWVLMPESV